LPHYLAISMEIIPGVDGEVEVQEGLNEDMADEELS
jgi:hypothetical protein